MRYGTLATILAMSVAAHAWGVEAEMSQMAREQLAELKGFLKSRDIGDYELEFTPLDLDRIVMQERSGKRQVFHYLTFRLRNAKKDSATFIQENYSHFNQVMESIIREYEGVSYDNQSGAKLLADGAAHIQDDELKTIVALDALDVQTRKVNLTVVAWDENKTAFKLFDEWRDLDAPPQVGVGAAENQGVGDNYNVVEQDEWNFPDLGDTRKGNYYYRVHQAIEERLHRRLLSVQTIRETELPPYDPSTIHPEFGWPLGQIDGVFIFDRLPIHGDEFTIHVNGLSNRMRSDLLKISEIEAGQVDDYFNNHIFRRTYVIKYRRPGDEYFLDLADFDMVANGWRWVPAFQRLRHRASIAYAKYFLLNIRAEDGGPDQAVEDQFWQYFNQVRTEQLPALWDAKKERAQKALTQAKDRYQGQIEERKFEADKKVIEELLQERKQVLKERIEEVEETKRALDDKLPDIESELQEWTPDRFLQ